ncbi:hypothetical protein WA158_003465 [Blastocystis sp. Blastoise]
MEQTILKYPSPGDKGIIHLGHGKENRNYITQPLNNAERHNPLMVAIPENSVAKTRQLKTQKVNNGNVDNYVNRDKMFGDNNGDSGGSLVVANPVTRIGIQRNGRGITNKKVISESDALEPKNGNGLAFNKAEMSKLYNSIGQGVLKAAGYSQEAMKDYKKWSKHRIRAGMLIPPSIIRSIASTMNLGGKGLNKVGCGIKRPSKRQLCSYINFSGDSSGNGCTVRRGGKFWKEGGGFLTMLAGIGAASKAFEGLATNPNAIKDGVTNLGNNIAAIPRAIGKIFTPEFWRKANENNKLDNNVDNVYQEQEIEAKKRALAEAMQPNNASGLKKPRKLCGRAFYEYMQKCKAAKRQCQQNGCGEGAGLQKNYQPEPKPLDSIAKSLAQLSGIINRNLISKIYKYGYLNNPCDPVACDIADSTMKNLNTQCKGSWKYWDNLNDFEHNIDNIKSNFNMLFHQSEDDPNFGHFEAVIYESPEHMKFYSSLGNSPEFSPQFIKTHNIQYNPIQFQSTASNSNGCFYYALLYLTSLGTIIPT